MSAPLWTPSADRIRSARLTAFVEALEAGAGVELGSYEALHGFSIAHPDRFWTAVWSFCGVRGNRRGAAIEDPDLMPGAQFFPQSTLNFAENVLGVADDRPAILFKGESGHRAVLTRRHLHRDVARAAGALRAAGITAGDRVAGYLPNIPETIVAALATASIGAIWSSCSPDFGIAGVVDRFGQISPKLLIAADGYVYGGKEHDTLSRLPAIARDLPTVQRVVVVPYAREHVDLAGLPGTISWPEFLGSTAQPLTFEPLPFNHPLYILYSSGTTGPPKCILHGAGGTLLQHVKEHQLQCDIRPNDRVFYFTTCGWMMWNWLVTVLASDAAIVLYDGSPFHPDGNALFDLADAMDMTLFGTSARFIAAVEKAGLTPASTHRLHNLRTITSTGSPLLPESFDFVYRAVKSDVHLASISGGTDIVSCFVGGVPTLPVWKGEIQAAALGMDVDVFDEAGRPLRGQAGELVCRKPFPSMPLRFWNDPDGRQYHRAYFDRFPGVWCHGDWAGITERGGFIIHGRSDAVLNPGGVRIGTAEIYRQVEQIGEVLESVVVGQRWEGDERILLFVRLRDGLVLDAALRARIKERIRGNATPRHVPAKILQVSDIPRTKSGKIVELAVRDVIHGRRVRNREALANPEALDQFVGRELSFGPEGSSCGMVDSTDAQPALARVNIRAEALEALRALDVQDPSGERCGLLVGQPGTIERLHAARNAADHPHRYLIDPRDHFDAIREARRLGQRVVGAYHTHPHGPAVPSERDRAEVNDRDLLHVIVSPGRLGASREIRAWRLVGGNFTEVALVTWP
jgi:acetoacetyl-CoA synthetase